MPGFAARRPVVIGPTGARGPLTGRSPSCARPDCLFVLAVGSAGPGGKSYGASGRLRRRCPLESGLGPLLEVRSDGP